MLFSALWLAIAFILCSAASSVEKRASNIIIGFRTVSPEEAALYQNWGDTIIWQTPGAGNQGSSDQLGQGKYFTPVLGDWAGAANGWWCTVYADSNAWNNVNKVFVPNVGTSDSCAYPLWYGAGVPNRPGWLTSQGDSSYTLSNTVLVSEIEGFPGIYQFVIPPALLTSSNPLGITAKCVDKATAASTLVSGQPSVNWQSWANLRGPLP